MSLNDLKDVKIQFAEYQPGDTIGLEFRLPLNFMVVGFGNVIRDISDRFSGSKVLSVMLPTATYQQVARKMDKIPYSSMDKYLIRVPEGMKGEMLPYLQTLNNSLEALSTTRTRVLEPLHNWAAKALSDKGFVDRVWMDRNISFADIEEIKEKLKEHYDERISDDIAFAKITEVYPRSSDFKAAAEYADKVAKLSTEIIGQDLNKLADDTATLIKRLVDENDKSDFMANTPRATIAKLSEVVYQAALEVELLSVVLFQARTATVAFTESVEKMNKEL